MAHIHDNLVNKSYPKISPMGEFESKCDFCGKIVDKRDIRKINKKNQCLVCKNKRLLDKRLDVVIKAGTERMTKIMQLEEIYQLNLEDSRAAFLDRLLDDCIEIALHYARLREELAQHEQEVMRLRGRISGGK